MTPTKIASLAIIVQSFAIPTLAAETSDKNFDGFYLGTQIGINRIKAQNHGINENNTSLNYEGFIGYRYQTDTGWVVGIEGALGDRTGEISNENRDLKFGYMWHWTANVGKVIGNDQDKLIYGKFGVGGIQVSPTVHGTVWPKENYQGKFMGVGIEQTLSKRISIRAEIDYISYHPGFNQVSTKIGLLVKF